MCSHSLGVCPFHVRGTMNTIGRIGSYFCYIYLGTFIAVGL